MSYRDKCEQLYLENQELKERLREAKKEIDELYSGRLGACHTCEQVAELNIKLEQQLKEAESVIDGLSKYYDLYSEAWSASEYEFLLNQPATFKAIYGDQTFIEEALNNIKVEVLNPYPNPFSDNIHLPINLPYSQEAYDIECRIFNLMGEKVFEQDLEDIMYGLYHIEWKENQLRNLKQGIYIYSIKIENGFLTNNFNGRIVKN